LVRGREGDVLAEAFREFLSGVCLQTFFEDPDGNALALHHRYEPPAE
jgi:hypothetical protein